MFFENFDLNRFLISMCALVIAITIHEFAHAFSAYRAGDDTPKVQGRISLNPFDHLDPMGTIMMVMSSISGFGIGWGKAVRVNPFNFNSPRWDNLRVSLWGPLSNLISALVVGTVLRFWAPVMSDQLFLFLAYFVMISIGLAVFNLIPIAPLDGSHILSSLLPQDKAVKYDRVMGQYGVVIFLALIFLAPGVLGVIMGPPRDFFWKLFTGI